MATRQIDDIENDWYEPFIAIITAITVPSSGPFAGIPVYDFIEQQQTSSAAFQNDLVPLKGTFSVDGVNNPLFENNNLTVTVGVYVDARFRSMIGGLPSYQFDAPNAAGCQILGGSISSIIGYDPTQWQVLVHAPMNSSSPGCLMWVNIGNCSASGS